jgi:hypothetical protein
MASLRVLLVCLLALPFVMNAYYSYISSASSFEPPSSTQTGPHFGAQSNNLSYKTDNSASILNIRSILGPKLSLNAKIWLSLDAGDGYNKSVERWDEYSSPSFSASVDAYTENDVVEAVRSLYISLWNYY